MSVRIGKITFSDWVSLKFEDGWTDTFIFHIDALNGLPPFVYHPLLQRLTAHLKTKRSGASLWVQVDGPGEWYLAEVKYSLLFGLNTPCAVTSPGKQPDWTAFSSPPRLWHDAPKRPPAVEDKYLSLSAMELNCLRILARTKTGDEEEIASLSDLSVEQTCQCLATLKDKHLVKPVNSVDESAGENNSSPKQGQKHFWILKDHGLSLALRSWGAPSGVEFTARQEEQPHHAQTPHRRISRRWPAWLRSAWPHAEIWTGWSEVRMPEMSVIPDGLAWGKMHGFETLFWLEVGDEHKNKEHIEKITRTRLHEAVRFCQKTGVRLVYAQLSMGWVGRAALWGTANLPMNTAVVMGNMHRFGELPVVEWGATSMF